MFAKLFGHDNDQVLMKLDTGKEGNPEVRVFFEPEGLGVCSWALEFEDSEDGWDKAEKAFAAFEKEEILKIVSELKQSIGEIG